MTLITLEDAEREFAASVAYYESREPGLGLRFRDEVEAIPVVLGVHDGLWRSASTGRHHRSLPLQHASCANSSMRAKHRCTAAVGASRGHRVCILACKHFDLTDLTRCDAGMKGDATL